MERKILLISYAFPPLSAPEAFLSAKTLKNLNGFQVDVLCATPNQGILPPDTSLAQYTQSFGKIFQIPTPKWVRFFQHWPILSRGLSFFSVFPDKAVYLNRTAYQKVM